MVGGGWWGGWAWPLRRRRKCHISVRLHRREKSLSKQILLLLLFFFFSSSSSSSSSFLLLRLLQLVSHKKTDRNGAKTNTFFFCRPVSAAVGKFDWGGRTKKNNNREKNHHRSRIPCFDFDFPYVGIFNATTTTTTTTKHFPKKRGNAMIRSFRWTTTMGVGRPDRDTHTKKKTPKIKQNSVKCR